MAVLTTQGELSFRMLICDERGCPSQISAPTYVSDGELELDALRAGWRVRFGQHHCPEHKYPLAYPGDAPPLIDGWDGWPRWTKEVG